MFNRFNLSNFSSSGGDTSSADTANHEGTSTKSNTCVATKIDADKLLEKLKVKPPPFHPEERLLVIESWEAVEQHIAQVAQQLSKSIIIIIIIILIIIIIIIIVVVVVVVVVAAHPDYAKAFRINKDFFIRTWTTSFSPHLR